MERVVSDQFVQEQTDGLAFSALCIDVRPSIPSDDTNLQSHSPVHHDENPVNPAVLAPGAAQLHR